MLGPSLREDETTLGLDQSFQIHPFPKHLLFAPYPMEGRRNTLSTGGEFAVILHSYT